MSKDKVERLKDDLEITEPGAILAKLYRIMLNDLGVTPAKFSALVDRYVSHVRELSKRFKYVKPVYRSTLINNFTSNAMTWKVFLQATFNVLMLKKIKFTVTAYHANGRETVHSIVVHKPSLEPTDNNPLDLEFKEDEKRSQ